MKTLTYSISALLLLMLSCKMPYGQTTQSDVFQSDAYNTAQPKNADWYKSAGYQVFERYDLAIKAPVMLENMASHTTEKHQFNYAGIHNKSSKTNIAFYQVIINDFPPAYNSLTEVEKHAFREKMIRESLPRDAKRTKFNGHDAFIYNYRHNNYSARSLIVLENGRSYGFSLITNSNLDSNFENFLSNIHFITL